MKDTEPRVVIYDPIRMVTPDDPPESQLERLRGILRVKNKKRKRKKK